MEILKNLGSLVPNTSLGQTDTMFLNVPLEMQFPFLF